MPPRCAKCATPAWVPVTPSTSSNSPYNVTNTRAGIGIGGISNITRRSGNTMAKASSKPNTPPEAPTTGTAGPPDSCPIASCANAPASTLAK